MKEGKQQCAVCPEAEGGSFNKYYNKYQGLDYNLGFEGLGCSECRDWMN